MPLHIEKRAHLPRGALGGQLRARAAVKRDVAYWRGLVRSTSGAVGVFSNGRLLAWSRGAQKLFGYSAREVTGRFCWDIFAACDDRGARICSKDCRPFRAARAGRPVPTVAMHVKPKVGRPIRVTCNMLVVPAAPPGGPITVHLLHEASGVGAPAAQPAEHPRQRAGPAAATGTAAALTPHQRKILQLLSTGMTTESLAESLHVSPKTIRNHLNNIFLRLGVHNRLEAVMSGIASGLLSTPPKEPGPATRSC